MSSPLQNPPPAEESDSLQHATPHLEDLMLHRSHEQAISDAEEIAEFPNPFRGTSLIEDGNFKDSLQHRTTLCLDGMEHTSFTRATDSPSSKPEQIVKVNSGPGSESGSELLNEMWSYIVQPTDNDSHSSSASQIAGQSANGRKRVKHTCHSCGDEFPTFTQLQSHDCHQEIKDFYNLTISPKRSRYWKRGELSFCCESLANNNASGNRKPSRNRKRRCRNHRILKCHICSIPFLSQTHLTLHVRITHNAAEYTCRRCKTKFVDRIDRAHHELVHLGVSEQKRACRLRLES